VYLKRTRKKLPTEIVGIICALFRYWYTRLLIVPLENKLYLYFYYYYYYY